MATKIKAQKLISPSIGSDEIQGSYVPSRGVKLVAIKTTKSFNQLGKTLVGIGKVTEEIRDIVKGNSVLIKDTAEDLERAKDRAKDDAAEREAEGAGKKVGAQEKTKGKKELKKKMPKGKKGPLAWLDKILGPLKPLVEWLARTIISKVVLEWFADPKNLEKVETFWNTLSDIGTFIMGLAEGSIGALFDGFANIFGGADKIKNGKLGGAWDMIVGFGQVLMGIAGLKVLGWLLNPFSLVQDIMGMADAIDAWQQAEAAKDAVDAANDARKGADAAADNVRSRQQILEQVQKRHGFASAEQAEEYLRLKKAATEAGEEITDEVTTRLVRQARKNRPAGIFGKMFNWAEDAAYGTARWLGNNVQQFMNKLGEWGKHLKGSLIDRPADALKKGFAHAKKKYNLPNNFAELWARMSDTARKKFDDGVKWSKSVGKGMLAKGKAGWGAISGAVGGAANYVSEQGKKLGGFAQEQAMKYIVQPMKELFKPALNFFKGLGDSAWKAITNSPMGQMVEQYLQKKGIGSLSKPLPLLGKVGAKGIAIIGGLVNLMFALSRAKEGDLIGAMYEALSAGFDLSGVFGFAPGPFISLGIDIFSLIRDLVPGIRELEEAFIDKIPGMRQAYTMMQGIASKMPDPMGDMINNIVSAFQGKQEEKAKGGTVRKKGGKASAIARYNRQQEKYIGMATVMPTPGTALAQTNNISKWNEFAAGGSTHNHPNGQVPAAEMVKVHGYPGGWGQAGSGILHKSVATQFQSMMDAAKKAGHMLGINDTYRTYDDQVYMKQTKGNLAATPGTSKHGLGLAADLNYTDDGYKWLWANSEKFGFTTLDKGYWGLAPNRPGQHEAWHFENLTGTGAKDPNVQTSPASAADVGGSSSSSSAGTANTNAGGNALPVVPSLSPEQMRQNAFDALAKAFDETRQVMGFAPREVGDKETANPVNEAADGGKTNNTTPTAAPSSQPSVADQSAKNALDRASEAVEKGTAKTEPVILPITKTKVLNTSSEVVVTTKSTNASYPTK